MKNRSYIMFLLPSLLGVSVFVLFPFADVVLRSFLDVSGENFCGFENYWRVCSNQAFCLAFGNTGKFLAVCVPLLLGLSLMLANLVYFGGAKFYRKVCLLPVAIPAASLAFVWKMIFHRCGLLNSCLGTSADWLNSSHAFWVLTASFLWKNTGYYTVLWLAGLCQIPGSLYEAAALDGAGSFAKFRYVTLPGLRPMASAAFILALTGVFKSYREAWMLAGEYPDASIYMVQHVFHNWFRDMSMENMAAGAAMLVCLFTAAVYPFCRKGGGNLDGAHS